MVCQRKSKKGLEKRSSVFYFSILKATYQGTDTLLFPRSVNNKRARSLFPHSFQARRIMGSGRVEHCAFWLYSDIFLRVYNQTFFGSKPAYFGS